MDKTVRIRELNDAFRKSFVGGKVVVTEGVDGLSDGDKIALLTKVRTFDDFHRDNDPHHEHDFVRVEHDGSTNLVMNWVGSGNGGAVMIALAPTATVSTSFYWLNPRWFMFQ